MQTLGGNLITQGSKIKNRNAITEIKKELPGIVPKVNIFAGTLG
jgi:hypothetical protein